MNRMLSIHVLAGAVAVPLLAFAGPAAALTPSQFVVFGDSFVDAGVVWEFTGRVQPDAALGFWQGRFSDGPTWVDYLGYANLGAPTANFYAGNPAGTVPGAPGFSFTPGATNFAVGGARASGDAGMIPGLPTQVSLYSAYLAATGQLPDINTLFILNFGNNDVSAIQAAVGNPALQAQIATAYVTNMVNTVVGLAGFGAQHILVAGVPNPTEAEGIALQAALDLALDGVQANPGFGANLYRFDYFNFFNALLVDPTVYGLPAGLDVVNSCLDVETPGPDIDCSNYLLFDGIHVTQGVQQALSIEIGRLVGLAVVPEPATWAMMIAGFGLVGCAARRRTSIAT